MRNLSQVELQYAVGGIDWNIGGMVGAVAGVPLAASILEAIYDNNNSISEETLWFVFITTVVGISAVCAAIGAAIDTQL